MSIKNSGAPVKRGDYDAHLLEDWRTAHKIFEHIKAGGYAVDQQAWIAPTLTNSWANFDAANYSPAGYFKDTLGIVHLRGAVKSGTIGQAIFTLPVGYRPPKIEWHPAISSSPSTLTLSLVTVSSDGQVIASAGANTWFSLDGITFRAA